MAFNGIQFQILNSYLVAIVENKYNMLNVKLSAQ